MGRKKAADGGGRRVPPLLVRLNAEQIQVVETLAAKRGVSRGQVVKDALALLYAPFMKVTLAARPGDGSLLVGGREWLDQVIARCDQVAELRTKAVERREQLGKLASKTADELRALDE